MRFASAASIGIPVTISCGVTASDDLVARVRRTPE
jgi:hypothetical protein